MRLAKLCATFGLAIALSACAQATPAPNPLTPLPYADAFDDPNSGWQTLSDLSADVKYDAGTLRILVKQENLTQWSTAGKRFKDATFQVSAQPNGGPTDNGFGVMFRVQDRKNFYHFEVSSDGYWRSGIVTDGAWANWDDWQPHPAIKAGGEPNVLKVSMTGPKFTFFINDQPVATKEDATYAEGDIGVLALTLIDAPGTDISFDDVQVNEAPAP